MQFDDILVKIGEFGTYQKRIYVVIILMWICVFPFCFLSIFVLGVPQHRCKIPDFPNDSFAVQNQLHESMISKYIPTVDNKSGQYSDCYLFEFSNSDVRFDISGQPINASVTKCSEWVYSTEIFQETFTSKMQIVCDQLYKVSLLKTIYFIGMFVGPLVIGIISDRIGRKKTLLISTTLISICTLCLVWATSYITFAILQFCVGGLGVGLVVTTYITGMELIGPSKRTLVGVVLTAFGPIGGLYLTSAAYILRSWKYIEIAVAVPMMVCFIPLCFIPESPRWLLNRRKMNDVHKILKKAAKVNRTALPDDCFTGYYETKENQSSSLKDICAIFTRKTLFVRTVIISFNWMAIFVSYFGLSYISGDLYGEFYLNNLFSVIVEIPGNILPILILNRWGRKRTHCLFMIFGGLSCLGTVITTHLALSDLQILTTVLAMIGKCCVTSGLTTFYIFSAELYPTAIRNAGFGLCYSCARIGIILSPFLNNLVSLVDNKTGEILPVLIFGGITILAGISALWLPETQDTNLAETIEDVILTKDIKQ